MGYQIPISFQGRNLDSYMVRSVRAADLLLHKHPNIVVNIICVIISLSCVCVCVCVSPVREWLRLSVLTEVHYLEERVHS